MHPSENRVQRFKNHKYRKQRIIFDFFLKKKTKQRGLFLARDALKAYNHIFFKKIFKQKSFNFEIWLKFKII